MSQYSFLDDEGLRHLLESIKNYFASKAEVSDYINNLDVKKVDKSTYNSAIARIDNSISSILYTHGDKEVIEAEIRHLDDIKVDKTVYDAAIEIINNYLDSLNTGKVDVNDYNSDKSSIQDDIDELSTSLSDLTSTHETDISSINDSLESIENDIESLGNTKLDVSTYNDDKNEIDNSISNIQDSLGELSNSKVDNDTFEATVDNIEDSIDDINSSIETIDTSIETINTSIGTLEESINGLDTSVSNIESSIDTIEGSIDGISSSLSSVATSGDYDDLLNKPELSQVATSGDYEDLLNKPTIPGIPENVSSFTNDAGYITQNDIPTDVSDFNNDAGYITISDVPSQVNADWDSVSGASEILNKPTFATVATSGDYNDLQNKPTIPDAPVQSDWNEIDTNSLAYIQNKPTIPAAQVNADWDSSSGVSEILHKPSLSTVATSGDYDDLQNKPTIPTVNDSTITFIQGETTKGTITLNQGSNGTITLDATNPELESTVENIDDRLSDVEDILDQFDITVSLATKTYVDNSVRLAKESVESDLNDHERDTTNPHKVTYNQVGLEVIEDIESEPEEQENPDPSEEPASEEPDYKYIASIDYVKQYVSERGMGLEALQNLEGTGREGVLYIYEETLYIWEDGENEGEGEYIAVSTSSDGVSIELREKILAAYDHISDRSTNPHNITKETVELGNVDNTSDADKPLSNAAVIALARKVNTSEIVDNLTTQIAYYPLSANMGYELNSKYSALDLKIGSLGSALKFKGIVPSYASLRGIQDPDMGDCYQIVAVSGTTPGPYEGHMFGYTEDDNWVEISGSFGLDFVTASMNEVQSVIDSYQPPESSQGGESSGEGGEGGSQEGSKEGTEEPEPSGN